METRDCRHFIFDIYIVGLYVTISVADDADLLEPAFPIIRIFNDQRTAAVVLYLNSDQSVLLI